MGWFSPRKVERLPWAIRIRVNVLPHGGTTLVEAALPVARGAAPVRLFNLHRFPDEPVREVSAELPAEVAERLRGILEGAYPDGLLPSDPSNCCDGVSFHLAVARADEKPVSVWFRGFWGSPKHTSWRELQGELPAVRIGWEFLGLVFDSYDAPARQADSC